MLARSASTWPATPFNLSFLLALVCCLAVWLLIWRTRLGYEIRTVGANPTAARLCRHLAGRITIIAMLSVGRARRAASASTIILGDQHRLILEFAGGFGFVGIAVALMGRAHPVGIMLAAILFGVLYQGGAELAFDMPKISRDMIVVIQGLVDAVRRRAGAHVPPPLSASAARAAAPVDEAARAWNGSLRSLSSSPPHAAARDAADPVRCLAGLLVGALGHRRHRA